jgi:hypothetical protein
MWINTLCSSRKNEIAMSAWQGEEKSEENISNGALQMTGDSSQIKIE